jgi:sulfur carrier protein
LNIKDLTIHKHLKSYALFILFMQIQIFLDRKKEEKTVEVDENTSVKDLLTKINVNPVTVIVSKDNNILTEDEKLNDNDKIKLISVISGG